MKTDQINLQIDDIDIEVHYSIEMPDSKTGFGGDINILKVYELGDYVDIKDTFTDSVIDYIIEQIRNEY